MDDELHSVSDVIQVLGGPSAVARLTGRSNSAPTNWKADGKFPPATFIRLSAELERLGCHASPSLWGMDEPLAHDPKGARPE